MQTASSVIIRIPADLDKYDPSRYGQVRRDDDKDDGSEVGRCGTIQNRMITGLEVVFNAAGERQYKKRARQFQYVELAGDGDEDGLAPDGKSFSVLFSGFHVQRLTVRGRNLQRYFSAIKDHRLSSLRAVDRDFDDVKEPVVTEIRIERVAEQA